MTIGGTTRESHPVALAHHHPLHAPAHTTKQKIVNYERASRICDNLQPLSAIVAAAAPMPGSNGRGGRHLQTETKHKTKVRSIAKLEGRVQTCRTCVTSATYSSHTEWNSVWNFQMFPPSLTYQRGQSNCLGTSRCLAVDAKLHLLDLTRTNGKRHLYSSFDPFC